MGFFSGDCKSCGHPLLSLDACNVVNYWMNQGIAITPDDTIMTGFYDGYGRLFYGDDEHHTVIGFDDEDDDYFTVPNSIWHLACWVAAGSPTTYQGRTVYSPDQGWFFSPGTHDMKEPR